MKTEGGEEGGEEGDWSLQCAVHTSLKTTSADEGQECVCGRVCARVRLPENCAGFSK